MRYSLTVLLLVAVINLVLGDPRHSHDHKHHHRHRPRYPSTDLLLSSCASKLDFLCLGQLFTLSEQYRANINNTISALKDKINTRVSEFESSRDALKESYEKDVFDTVMILLQRISERAISRPNGGIGYYNCLYNWGNQTVKNLRDTFLGNIQKCVEDNQLNLTDTNVAIANLTSFAVADETCKCVENIKICSTTEQKFVAKGCAEIKAAALNIELIQNKAALIYSDVDFQINANQTSLQACLEKTVNIPPIRQLYLDFINSCT